MFKIAYHPIYALPLPAGHRFPMLKYELIPGQLLHEGTITQDNIFAPAPCPEEVILWTHDLSYWQEIKSLSLNPQHIRRIGFPLSPQLVQREIIISQGTIDCCHFAMAAGVALNVAGGTHHAFRDRGEGFCLLNDVAIAANYLLHHRLAGRILVVDLDVHQGNGTASLFASQPSVFTFSMHGGHNYPFIKEKSDLDVPLPDYTGDKAYLDLLGTHLAHLMEVFQPDFVFYVAGVDILSTDKFGKLGISIQGCRQRDQMVFQACMTHKIPCVAVMGGGYSPDVRTIVEAHCNTFRIAQSVFWLVKFGAAYKNQTCCYGLQGLKTLLRIAQCCLSRRPDKTAREYFPARPGMGAPAAGRHYSSLGKLPAAGLYLPPAKMYY